MRQAEEDQHLADTEPEETPLGELAVMIAVCVLIIAVALHFRATPADKPPAAHSATKQTQHDIIHTDNREVAQP